MPLCSATHINIQPFEAVETGRSAIDLQPDFHPKRLGSSHSVLNNRQVHTPVIELSFSEFANQHATADHS
jgi:hypothetical protein